MRFGTGCSLPIRGSWEGEPGWYVVTDFFCFPSRFDANIQDFVCHRRTREISRTHFKDSFRHLQTIKESMQPSAATESPRKTKQQLPSNLTKHAALPLCNTGLRSLQPLHAPEIFVCEDQKHHIINNKRALLSQSFLRLFWTFSSITFSENLRS